MEYHTESKRQKQGRTLLFLILALILLISHNVKKNQEPESANRDNETKNEIIETSTIDVLIAPDAESDVKIEQWMVDSDNWRFKHASHLDPIVPESKTSEESFVFGARKLTDISKIDSEVAIDLENWMIDANKFKG
jgi:hypothetical protein